MMNIHTYDLFIFFKGYQREYYNISNSAVKYFLSYHVENPDFYGYEQSDHVPHLIR